MKITIRELRDIVRASLFEVDTDPSNNPGRPDDPFDYLGMHPPANAAMAHPAAGGGAGSVGGDSTLGGTDAGPDGELDAEAL